jgi:hypothetical protein
LDRYLAVDLSGAFYAFVRRCRICAGRRRVVAISSIAAQMCQARNVRCRRKAGLEAIARRRARGGAARIRAKAAPSASPTPRWHYRFRRMGAESTDRVVRGIPLRRIGTPRRSRASSAFWPGLPPPTSPAGAAGRWWADHRGVNRRGHEEEPVMASATLVGRSSWRSQLV